jgi:Transglycosylase SLT domain
MLVNSSNSASSAVTGAIQQASQATGTSFNYLLATAQVESGLNPQAGASTSSARGLFQFIETTWLATIKQAGAALGLGRFADAITQTASGNYEVRDPAMRGEILKLRNDPAANALMAGAFTKGNASALSERLGRTPSEGELYIAHFLGVGGAARLIGLAGSNPNARAADYFPNAAQANPSIFYDRSTGAAAASPRCATSSPPAMTWRGAMRTTQPRRLRKPIPPLRPTRQAAPQKALPARHRTPPASPAHLQPPYRRSGRTTRKSSMVCSPTITAPHRLLLC